MNYARAALADRARERAVVAQERLAPEASAPARNSARSCARSNFAGSQEGVPELKMRVILSGNDAVEREAKRRNSGFQPERSGSLPSCTGAPFGSSPAGRMPARRLRLEA